MMIQTNRACWNPAFKTNTYFLPYKNTPYLFTIWKITPFTNMVMPIHTDRTVDMVQTVTSYLEQLTSHCSGKTICTAPTLSRYNTGECKSKPSCGTVSVQPQTNRAQICQPNHQSQAPIQRCSNFKAGAQSARVCWKNYNQKLGLLSSI